jgi:peptidoglycan/LPS O-acetylase OafA/YrhL
MPASAILAPQVREVMPALTGLRFPLAGLVMMFHIAGQQMERAPWWLGNIVSRGYLAVNAFFILSGFVLAHSYLDPEGRMRGERKNFWIARFARIYPVYALTIILSFPNRFHYGLDQPAGWGDAVASFTVFALLQAWIPAFALLINSAAWSLSAEAFFYLGFPVWIKLTQQRTKQGILLLIVGCWIACLALPAICLIAARFGEPHLTTLFAQNWFSAFIQYNPLFHVPAFIMGVATQRLFLLERSGPLVNSWRSAALSALSLLSIGFILAAGSPIPRILIHNGLLGLAFACLIFGLASGRGWIAGFLARPIPSLLGEASYALYLLHLPLWAMIRSANATTLQIPEPSWGFLVLMVAIILMVSILALKCVETPYRTSISLSLRQWLNT